MSTYALPSPHRQERLNLFHDLLASGGAIQAIRQQFIVIGVVVAHCGGNRKGQGLLFELSAGLRPADAAASPLRGVFSDGRRLSTRAAGK
jgi:hypothetical protein